MKYLQEQLSNYEKTREGAPAVPALKLATYLSVYRLINGVLGGLSAMTTLEAGAGSGLGSIVFALNGSKAFALDKWSNSCRLHDIVRRSIGTSVCFLYGEISALPFADDSIDFVFNVDVLDHYDPTIQLQIMKEMCRVSRKWIMIGVPNNHPLSAFSFFSRYSPEYDNSLPHLDINLRSLCESAGVRVHLEDGASVFLTNSELGGEQGETFAFHRRLSPELPADAYDLSMVEALVDLEANLTTSERLKFGFLHVILGETGV